MSFYSNFYTKYIKGQNLGCAVLLYHRVFDPVIDAQLLSVTPKNFEKHINFLKENYEIISYHSLLERIQKKTLNNRCVCLTFDDGYLDNYLHAFPILERYNVPATIFVCTANIGSNNEFWWDSLENILFSAKEEYSSWNALSSLRDPLIDRYLNLQECFKILNEKDRSIILDQINPDSIPARQHYRTVNLEELSLLSSSGLISLGAHTVNHYSLGKIGFKLAQYEVTKSVQTIRGISANKLVPFSYPFGGENDCRNDLSNTFMTAGIDGVFINQFGICNNSTDKYNIPRILVRDLEVNEFGSFVNNLWN